MAYDNIKNQTEALIRQNGNGDIEGDLDQVLRLNTIDVLSDFDYRGNVVPDSDAPSAVDLDRKLMYTASTNGTYTNYGGFILDNELVIFTWDGTEWAKNKIITIPSNQPYAYTSQVFSNATLIMVNHNFGVYPVITVYDEDGYVVTPYSTRTVSTLNTTVVEFTEASSGVVAITLGSPDTSTPYEIKTADYTLTNSDDTIEVSTSGVTITLPTAVGNLGKKFRIINTSNAIVRVETTSSQTIGNKSTGNPIFVILNPEDYLDVQSNNINYRQI